MGKCIRSITYQAPFGAPPTACSLPWEGSLLKEDGVRPTRSPNTRTDMASQLFGNPDKVSRVKLSAGERHIQLTIRLSHEFAGGDIVRFPPGAAVSVEGADESSSTYSRSNWASGIASGALYAFR